LQSKLFNKLLRYRVLLGQMYVNLSWQGKLNYWNILTS